MSLERFDNLLSLGKPLIEKKNTNLQKSISDVERLALTLRFLAISDS